MTERHDLCAGELKIRGTVKDLTQFFNTGLFYLHHPIHRVDIETTSDGITTINGGYAGNKVGIKGTAIWFDEAIDWEKHQGTEKDIVIVPVVYCPVMLDVQGMVDVSGTYQLDFKITGFNSTVELNHHVEIHKGVVVQDLLKDDFEDYDWESINSTLGG